MDDAGGDFDLFYRDFIVPLRKLLKAGFFKRLTEHESYYGGGRRLIAGIMARSYKGKIGRLSERESGPETERRGAHRLNGNRTEREKEELRRSFRFRIGFGYLDGAYVQAEVS